MLEGKRIILTGASGFLGRHIIAQLDALMRRNDDNCGPRACFYPEHKQFDLTQEAEVQRMYENAAPGSDTIVIHCAAECGGIGLNKAQPGRLFYANLMMNTLMMEHAVWNKVGKYVAIGSICSYPAYPPVIPFHELDIWRGYPEETNAAYGMAKKMQLVQAEAYRQQYGLKVINLMLANLYGPGDNYDLETSHVIPGMIRRIYAAKQVSAPNVTLWGSGLPTRDFLYAPDAAYAILKAADSYEGKDPINIATEQETRIRDLARTIADFLDYTGDILWDESKPDGQMRRVLDVFKMRICLHWQPPTSVWAGLKETIRDFKLRRDEVLSRPSYDLEAPGT